MIRRVLLAGVLATAVGIVGGGAGLLPASAEDPSPTVTPPPVPDPSSGTPGPTYVITPGSGGSELPPPSDPDEVEKAMREDRARQAGAPSGSSSATPGASAPGGGGTPTSGPGTPTADVVAGPQVPLARVAGAEDPVGLLWRSIAGAVVMLVLFEITEVGRFLRTRRRVVAGP